MTINSPVTINNSPPSEDPLAARERYLQKLRDRCNVLPIADVGGEEDGSIDVTLDKVYIRLDTTSRIAVEKKTDASEIKTKPLIVNRTTSEQEDVPLPVLKAAASSSHRRFLLLGHAGSGKSTFVKQLVADMCSALLDKKKAPPEGWGQPLLPLFVTLGELQSALGDIDPTKLKPQEAQSQYCNAIRAIWLKQLSEWKASAFWVEVEKALNIGDVLLVFDGLDEVPEPLRLRMRNALAALQKEYSKIQQIIVTCRVRSYHDQLLPGFKVETLAAFDQEKIEAFVRAWYHESVLAEKITADEAEERCANLLRRVQDENLQKLAQNPMLLTTMAIIHRNRNELPERRVDLYKLAVDVLLKRWQNSKNISISDNLAALLKGDDVLELLRTIAVKMHEQEAKSSPDKPNENSKDESGSDEARLCTKAHVNKLISNSREQALQTGVLE